MRRVATPEAGDRGATHPGVERPPAPRGPAQSHRRGPGSRSLAASSMPSAMAATSCQGSGGAGAGRRPAGGAEGFEHSADEPGVESLAAALMRAPCGPLTGLSRSLVASRPSPVTQTHPRP